VIARLGWLAGSVVVASSAAGLLALARSHLDPHDGSCTAVLARNLAAMGAYGYAKYGRFELWPVEATTGPTLVVPIAIAYRLAGEGPFVANVASALVVLALLVLVWWRMMPRLASASGVVSAVLALATIVGLTIEPSVAFVVPRGEVVAGLLLVLATLVALDDDGVSSAKRAVASGLLSGLGVASKVLLLLPSAVLLLGVVALGLGARGRRRPLAVGSAWLAGLLAVPVGVEAWKLAAFGGWQPYADRWREYAAFFRMAGSGLREGATALTERRTLSYRLGVLHENLGLVPVALLLALAAVAVLLWRARRKGGIGVDGRIALLLGAETVAVSAWWLLRADIPWLRYLFFACITAPLCVHFAVLEAGRRRAHGSAIALGAWAVLLGLALAGSPAGTFSWPGPSEKQSARVRAVLDASRVVREIAAADQKARFWSAGWWQHWDLQSVARLDLHDVLDASSLGAMRDGHDYLVTSDYFNWEQDPRLLALLDAHERRVAYRNAFFTIYRIHPVLTRKALRAARRGDSAAPWRTAPESGG